MTDQSNIKTNWERLLSEFRSFGGTAENVIQREGDFGLGLFPIDPSKPVKLRAPDHLLVASDNLQLKDGQISIKDESKHPEGFGDWYKRFQQDYSWGAEARQSIQRFEAGLRELPLNARQLLNKFCRIPIGKRIPGMDEEQELLQRFILTRQISRKGQTVLMPLIELVNHSPSGASWGMNDEGINVEGVFQGEILVRYSVSDPIQRFLQYGFHCPEKMAFSMTHQVMHKGLKFNVIGGINYEAFSRRPVKKKGDYIEIYTPILGAENRPRMPRTVFRETCQGLNGVDPDELFDQIHHQNRMTLIKLLKELKTEKSELTNMLRSTCFEQLLALSENIGSLKRSS